MEDKLQQEIQTNIWLEESCDIVKATMYWLGFPMHCTLNDMWNFDTFDFSRPKAQQNKEHARRHQALDMVYEMADKIRKKTMHGIFLHKDLGPYMTTTLEFLRFARARDYMPYDLDRVQEDILKAPDYLRAAIIASLRKRVPLSLSSTYLNLKKRIIPPCGCKGKSPCCIHKFLNQGSRNMHRKLVQKQARKINLNCLSKKGRDATPSEIYNSSSFQAFLKTLRDPSDPELIASYPDSLVKRNWIPQAIGKRKKGRPSVKSQKRAKGRGKN